MASSLQVEPGVITVLVNQNTVDIDQNGAKFAARNLGVVGKKLFEYVSENYSSQMKGHVMLRLYHHDMLVFDDMIHDMKNRKRYPK